MGNGPVKNSPLYGICRVGPLKAGLRQAIKRAVRRHACTQYFRTRVADGAQILWPAPYRPEPIREPLPDARRERLFPLTVLIAITSFKQRRERPVWPDGLNVDFLSRAARAEERVKARSALPAFNRTPERDSGVVFPGEGGLALSNSLGRAE